MYWSCVLSRLYMEGGKQQEPAVCFRRTRVQTLFSSVSGEPDKELNPKKKVWEQVQPELRTDDLCVATYKGAAFEVVGKGVCKAQTMSNSGIKWNSRAAWNSSVFTLLMTTNGDGWEEMLLRCLIKHLDWAVLSLCVPRICPVTVASKLDPVMAHKV